MKKTKIILTAVCIALVLGLSLVPAAAYFTAWTEAEGAIPVQLGYNTEMDEQVDGFIKTLTIKNNGPESCYVRAQAFPGADLKLEYSGTNWKAGEDGWYYYEPVVEAETSAAPLKIEISNPPADAKDGDEINVVVVYESAKVLYHEDGTPYPANYSTEANIAEGGNN